MRGVSFSYTMNQEIEFYELKQHVFKQDKLIDHLYKKMDRQQKKLKNLAKQRRIENNKNPNDSYTSLQNLASKTLQLKVTTLPIFDREMTPLIIFLNYLRPPKKIALNSPKWKK